MTIRQRLSRAYRSLLGYPSYSATGEDRLVIGWLKVVYGLKMPDIRYCDIGANDPRYLSNTFLMYRHGARGVLVEPDPTLCGKLRKIRPRDAVLNVGAAFDDQRSAMMHRFENSVFNTFSSSQADHIRRSSESWDERQRVMDEIEISLVPTNDILSQHFPDRLDFLSIDVEGYDLPVLQSIDLERFRPKIVCVEASADFGSIMSPLYEQIARTPDNLIYRLRQ